MLDDVLDDTKSPDEAICKVGTTVLKRLDFLSLGLDREVEATVSTLLITQIFENCLVKCLCNP